ncbi:hypothetical protein WA556_000904 [Blastocystis sp. ATCC 50177/Nand II]
MICNIQRRLVSRTESSFFSNTSMQAWRDAIEMHIQHCITPSLAISEDGKLKQYYTPSYDYISLVHRQTIDSFIENERELLQGITSTDRLFKKLYAAAIGNTNVVSRNRDVQSLITKTKALFESLNCEKEDKKNVFWYFKREIQLQLGNAKGCALRGASKDYLDGIHQDQKSFQSWLRSLTLFDRNALKKYCNDLRNYPAVTEDCVVSEKDGWSFMTIDDLHVVCIPPWRNLNPFYEPLLGYKNGNEVRIKNTFFNSSNSLPGPSRNQNAEKRQIDATNAAEKRRNTDCEIDETASEEEEVTSENDSILRRALPDFF